MLKTKAGTGKTFSLADLSMDDRSQLLSRAVAKAVGEYDCYLREVYDNYLVYYDYDEGCCYKCDYSIADDYTVTLGQPQEVIERSVYEPVKMSAFALPETFVRSSKVNLYPNSLLFEIQGDAEHFPNQGMTITKADLADIARSFSGASMGLQHIDTPLGDNCGQVQSVWLDASGRRLFGDVAIPKGLDELIPPGPRRVSVEIFHDATGKKCIPKVDLVLQPQIERAALMSLAAFAQGRTAAPYTIAAHTTPAHTGAEKDFTQARKGEETPHMSAPEMSTWDKIKAAFTDAGVKLDDDQAPAPVGTFSVAEFEANRRKAGLYDEQMGRRRAAAKSHAVIGFSADEAARFGLMVDAAPDGLLFEDLEARAAQAARKAAPEAGAARQTAPGQFGQRPAAQDADAAPPDAPAAPVLESADAVFARRAKEAQGR